MMQTADDVIHFWFVEHGRKDWFGGGPEFDRKLADRFAETHKAVARGEAWTWRATPEGRLAEVIVLDQFSRQLFRGDARAFAQDTMALVLAQEAVAAGVDKQLEPTRRLFLIMPYQHSESLVVHEETVRLFGELGMKEAMDFEMAHVGCLQRFGRYPRRNAALGRESTPEELEYIASDEGRW
jgi:uncharacterized protein (DUF924 family)